MCRLCQVVCNGSIQDTANEGATENAGLENPGPSYSRSCRWLAWLLSRRRRLCWRQRQVVLHQIRDVASHGLGGLKQSSPQTVD